MTLKENKTIVLKFLEAVNKQDFELMDNLLLLNFVNQTLKV